MSPVSFIKWVRTCLTLMLSKLNLLWLAIWRFKPIKSDFVLHRVAIVEYVGTRRPPGLYREFQFVRGARSDSSIHRYNFYGLIILRPSSMNSFGRRMLCRVSRIPRKATRHRAPQNDEVTSCKKFIKFMLWRVFLTRNKQCIYLILLLFSIILNQYSQYYLFFIIVPFLIPGSICNNDSQFICGVTSLCISSYLVCDGVRHCPGGEDEDPGACSHRHDPPLLELLRRFAARNQELLGLEQPDGMTKPSVISECWILIVFNVFWGYR